MTPLATPLKGVLPLPTADAATYALLRYLRSVPLALACVVATVFAPASFPSPKGIEKTPEIIRYQVTIEPEIQTGVVHGNVNIEIGTRSREAGFLQLDAGSLEFLAITENGRKLQFRTAPGKLTIELPGTKQKQPERVISISYRGKPQTGITFLPEHQQVFTGFSTSHWMPCIDAPHERAPIEISLVVPAGVKVAATGRHVGETARADGKVISKWVETAPIPSYLYGFAFGAFREIVDDSGTPTLHYLAPADFSSEEIRKIFRETRDMVAFYEKKAGLPYPGERYTQVLANASVAQEMSGLAVMSATYGRRVLLDEKRIWLSAHELSHQWWGNSVTNVDWTHFWLNEGIASFMSAAYLEHRFGADDYAKYIDAAKGKYEAVARSGKDRSLVFPDWDDPSAEDRTLVYDKGAYSVHLLRKLLGEEKFWTGMRHYVRKHWGSSVTSSDFQNAMEEGTGTILSEFFKRWIYRINPDQPHSRQSSLK